MGESPYSSSVTVCQYNTFISQIKRHPRGCPFDPMILNLGIFPKEIISKRRGLSLPRYMTAEYNNFISDQNK